MQARPKVTVALIAIGALGFFVFINQFNARD